VILVEEEGSHEGDPAGHHGDGAENSEERDLVFPHCSYLLHELKEDFFILALPST
jgi:hypothetical protein